ncbi:MAG: metallophosphoesterase [Bacteroidetes bacterium]|nr:metallophosphoesterase [Bacteroidota bacterium]
MKTIKFLHTADWHADSDPKKQNKLEASLSQIVEYCKSNKVNAIIHAGDIWEKKQSYDNKSGVNLVHDYLRHLSKLVDFIFITKGNNSHDEPGSVSLLHQLEPNIYAYEYPVVLGIRTPDDIPNDLLRFDNKQAMSDVNYIVTLVPYPTKASFISDQSIDNNNSDFLQLFEQVFENIGDITQPYTCPKILAFHGNVVGSRLSTGQTLVSQDIMVAPSTLEKAKHDYYALGHIHLRQFFKPNMGYSGSIYNKNWGETEQKSFEVIEFVYVPTDEFEICSEQIMLTSAKPMIKEELQFLSGEFFYKDGDEVQFYQVTEAEYRLRIEIKENDRALITDDKIQKLKNVFGEDVKIEYNIIPDQRESRSEKIMHCKSLLDEVSEYAAVIEFNINGTIKEKVHSISGEEVFS